MLLSRTSIGFSLSLKVPSLLDFPLVLPLEVPLDVDMAAATPVHVDLAELSNAHAQRVYHLAGWPACERHDSTNQRHSSKYPSTYFAS